MNGSLKTDGGPQVHQHGERPPHGDPQHTRVGAADDVPDPDGELAGEETTEGAGTREDGSAGEEDGETPCRHL